MSLFFSPKPFKPVFVEDADVDNHVGINFTSRKQVKKHCDKNNLTISGLYE